jgi:uncharacterized protein (DUF2267 family)
MGYMELIHTMKRKTGMSDAEAEDALDLMIEGIAERLPDAERKDFAAQLPEELQPIALSTEMSEHPERREDLVTEFMEKEDIDEARAQKQVIGAWETLKSYISDAEIKHIKSHLPNSIAASLT